METIKTDTVTLRKFGLTMAVACLVIASIVLIKAHYAPKPLVMLSLLFIGCAFIEPSVLRLFYILWMRLAFVLAWVNTRIILCILFFALFTPIAIAQKLCGVDLLDIKMDKGKTYWRAREKHAHDKSQYERLF